MIFLEQVAERVVRRARKAGDGELVAGIALLIRCIKGDGRYQKDTGVSRCRGDKKMFVIRHDFMQGEI